MRQIVAIIAIFLITVCCAYSVFAQDISSHRSRVIFGNNGKYDGIFIEPTELAGLSNTKIPLEIKRGQADKILFNLDVSQYGNSDPNLEILHIYFYLSNKNHLYKFSAKNNSYKILTDYSNTLVISPDTNHHPDFNGNIVLDLSAFYFNGEQLDDDVFYLYLKAGLSKKYNGRLFFGNIYGIKGDNIFLLSNLSDYNHELTEPQTTESVTQYKETTTYNNVATEDYTNSYNSNAEEQEIKTTKFRGSGKNYIVKSDKSKNKESKTYNENAQDNSASTQILSTDMTISDKTDSTTSANISGGNINNNKSHIEPITYGAVFTILSGSAVALVAYQRKVSNSLGVKSNDDDE